MNLHLFCFCFSRKANNFISAWMSVIRRPLSLYILHFTLLNTLFVVEKNYLAGEDVLNVASLKFLFRETRYRLKICIGYGHQSFIVILERRPSVKYHLLSFSHLNLYVLIEHFGRLLHKKSRHPARITICREWNKRRKNVKRARSR